MPTLTTAQIHAAADAITAAGGRPTMQAVRTHLGGGSYSTISPALASWRTQQQQAHAAAPVAGEPVPAQVAERATSLAGEIWSAALALADGRLAAERAALDQVRTDLEAERADALAAADAMATDLDAIKAQLAQQQQQHHQQQAEMDAARLEAARMAGQIAAQQAHIAAQQQQMAALLARMEPVPPSA